MAHGFARKAILNYAPIMTNIWAASFPLFVVDPWHSRGTCPKISADPQIQKYFYVRIPQVLSRIDDDWCGRDTYWLLNTSVFPPHFSTTSKLRWCEYVIWPMGYDWNWYDSFLGWTASERHWTPPAFFLSVLEKKIMELWENSFPGDSLIFQ